MNIFEKATREKVRFPYYGTIMVEDLWDLTLANLDDLYRRVNNALKTENGEGLIKKDNIIDNTSILQLQSDLISHVFKVRQEMFELAEKKILQQEKKKRIMEIISNKKDQSLEEKSIDELMNMLDEI